MPQLEGSLCPGRLGPIRRFRTARDRSAAVPATARPSLSPWEVVKSMRAISVEVRALLSPPSSVETRALLSPPSPVESRALQQPSKLAGPRLVGLRALQSAARGSLRRRYAGYVLYMDNFQSFLTRPRFAGLAVRCRLLAPGPAE